MSVPVDPRAERIRAGWEPTAGFTTKQNAQAALDALLADLAAARVAEETAQRVAARATQDVLKAQKWAEQQQALLDIAGIASDVSRYGWSPIRRLELASALARLDALRQTPVAGAGVNNG